VKIFKFSQDQNSIISKTKSGTKNLFSTGTGKQLSNSRVLKLLVYLMVLKKLFIQILFSNIKEYLNENIPLNDGNFLSFKKRV